MVVVAAAAAPAAALAAQPASERGGGLARLWSAYPLGPRAEGAAGDRTRQATNAPTQPAPVTRSVPSLDRDEDRVRPILVAAFGASASASALLFALFLVTAARSGVYARWALRRRATFTPAAYPYTSLNGAAPRVETEDDGGERRPATHLVFVPTESGYAMVEAEGEPPEVGSWVKGRYRVTKIGPSPLPEDRRRCVYLERS